MKKLIIVRADPHDRREVIRTFESDGYDIRCLRTITGLTQAVRTTSPAAVIVDVDMLEIQGGRSVHLDCIGTETALVFLTSGKAVQQKRKLLDRYGGILLRSPLDPLELQVALKREFEVRHLSHQLYNVEAEKALRAQLPRLVAKSEAMQKLVKEIDYLAPEECNLVVQGPRGCGKELVVRHLHAGSNRREQPLTVVPEERWPDQDRKTVRNFRGGTVFLPHPGEASRTSQIALANCIEEGLFKPVRIMVGTRTSLSRLKQDKRITARLYRLLAGESVRVPSLRERAADLPILVTDQIVARAKALGSPARRLGVDAADCLMNHTWTENLRELQMIIDHALLSCPALTVKRKHLPSKLRGPSKSPTKSQFPSLDEVERNHLLAALRQTGSNRSQAAMLLGVHRTTLIRKIRIYGITEKDVWK